LCSGSRIASELSTTRSTRNPVEQKTEAVVTCYWLLSDDDDGPLEPAAMLYNRTHEGELYVGEGEHPRNGRSKRSLLGALSDESGHHKPDRNKRSYSQEYFVEIMVVADKKMADYHGDGLYHYILTLMSIVSILCLLLLTYYYYNTLCVEAGLNTSTVALHGR
jgi:hypothetical protein